MYVHFKLLCKERGARYTTNISKNRKTHSQIVSACYTPARALCQFLWNFLKPFIYSSSEFLKHL